MRKVLYIIAAALVCFAAADAATRKSRIDLQFVEQPNGDYRLYLFATDRKLVCEEHEITVAQQGDAINPLVIECSHHAK